MKLKTTISLLLIVTAFMPSFAENMATDDPRIKKLDIERTDNSLLVEMSLDLSGMKLKSDREVTLTPVLNYGDSTLALPHIVVAGRNRYIQNERKRKLKAGEMLVKPDKEISYSAVVPYAQWMESAMFSLNEDNCGCGFNTLSTNTTDLARLDFCERTFAPQWAYITPKVEARKARAASGSAFIDFKVNRIEIDPTYRKNPSELKSIRDTIDVIKNDPDSKIERITITGYASPEGPFKNNVRLAEGRTQALAAYVSNLYHFPASVLHTASVAEDWAGLRKWVEESSVSGREGILDIIALEDLAPDVREQRIKQKYPETYRYLLDNVYPALRHSDYTIDYVVSSFTDPNKIAEVMAKDPRKLSMHELFLLAQTLPDDSERYREVFEVAVRMFPDNPVANLNAGVTALSFGDLERAVRYLKKAGDSPESVYAKAILAAKSGDYKAARAGLKNAEAAGLQKATDAIAQLDEYTSWLERKGKVF